DDWAIAHHLAGEAVADALGGQVIPHRAELVGVAPVEGGDAIGRRARRHLQLEGGGDRQGDDRGIQRPASAAAQAYPEERDYRQRNQQAVKGVETEAEAAHRGQRQAVAGVAAAGDAIDEEQGQRQDGGRRRVDLGGGGVASQEQAGGEDRGPGGAADD